MSSVNISKALSNANLNKALSSANSSKADPVPSYEEQKVQEEHRCTGKREHANPRAQHNRASRVLHTAPTHLCGPTMARSTTHLAQQLQQSLRRTHSSSSAPCEPRAMQEIARGSRKELLVPVEDKHNLGACPIGSYCMSDACSRCLACLSAMAYYRFPRRNGKNALHAHM